MLSKKIIFSNVVGLGFLLSMSSGVAANQMPMEMPHSAATKNVQFRKIEQPLGLKIGVTLGGLGLIGLELWWFIFSKKKAPKAEFKES